jgi:hypothetical protein
MKPTPHQEENFVQQNSNVEPKIFLMSNSLGKIESESSLVTADKRGLAERYMVGVRTIEEWHGIGIIRGARQGKRIFFDVGDCDSRLKQFSNQKGTYERN